MSVSECRSVLYMPATSERILAKGPTSAADAIIIDLEDAVAPDTKETARQNAIRALIHLDYAHRIRALRINAADSPWHEADLQAVAQAIPDAVVLPKVEAASQLLDLARCMDGLGMRKQVQIWAMMESPRAVLDAASIAACRADCPRLTMLVAGVNDLVREARLPLGTDRTFLIPWLMQLVAAARAHGLQIVDGVFNDFSDIGGFESECRQGRAMGMDGKTLIHPRQIELANRLFTPSRADIDEARAIVAAFDDPRNAGSGVLQINGRMVERLHLDMARTVLLRAAKLAERT